MQSFRNLLVWRKAHDLTLRLYKVTRTFPSEERYGLTSQVRRAASSVGANLAEGCVRRTPREFGRFVGIALGSASELEYHLLLAFDLELLTSDDYKQFDRSVREVKRMLVGLNRKLMAES